MHLSCALVLLLFTTSIITASHMSCNECLKLSKSLEIALLEQDRLLHAKHAPEGQHIRIGRKIDFRTEKDVDVVLDAWCDDASHHQDKRHDALHQACIGLLSLHRMTISNHILQEGWHHVRSMLCVDLTGACRAHELYDSGEL